MSDALKNAIQFESKETAPCSYTIEFKLPAAGVDAAFADALKEACKYAALPGFRKGKAPSSLVKARYAEYMNEDAVKRIQSAAFDRFVADEKNDIVSFGEMKAENKLVAGSDYNFSLDVELAPEFALPEYKGIEIAVEAGKTVEELAAERLDYVKNLYAEYTAVEDPAQEGDMLKVSYESDFELPADAPASLARSVKSDETWTWLNNPEQFPGIIKALTGVKKGDELSVTVNYPADWREAALGGKIVNYQFKIHEIERKNPVTDLDALAKKLQFETVEKMNEMLKKEAEQQAEFDKKAKAKEQILEFLLKNVASFELPKGVVASATEREFSRLAEQLVRKEEDVEPFKADREKHLETAKQNAREYLRKFFILRKLAKVENVSVDRQEMDRQISMMSYHTGRKEAEIREILEQNGGMAEVQAELLMSKVLDKLAGEAKIA